MTRIRLFILALLLMFLVLACSGKTQEKQNQDVGSNDYQTSDDSGSILTEDIIQDIFDTFLDKPEIINEEIGNFEIITEVTQEIEDANDTSENPPVQYIDECPTGLECLNYLPGTFCDPGYLIKVSEIQSICTRPCDVEDKDSCSDLVIATCCGNVVPFDQMPKYFCVPKDICCQPPNYVFCNGQCCPEGSECGEDGKTCTAKCKPPKPNPCSLACCPNNYDCECQEQGGFCLPGGAMMCDCEHQLWCEPLQECNYTCLEFGHFCKPLGAEDCPEAPDCYCEPGYVCTHNSPACCPQDAPVPCGDYCCPEDNDPLTNEECVSLTQEKCKGSGEEYCGEKNPECQIICPIGKECMEKQCGCKNDGEKECDDGVTICSVKQTCVTPGKGDNNSGCCPAIMGDEKCPPVSCDGYCCSCGTHCDPGCGGCVENGKFCCPDGVTPCGEKETCFSGGGACLDSPDQDCGSYYCNAGYICSGGPQKCCPANHPQTCGNQCCLSSPAENCINGICVPSGGEYCPGAPQGYCPIGNSCGKDWTQPCCCGTVCASPGGTCCDSNKSIYCGAVEECCGNTTKSWLCMPTGGECKKYDDNVCYCGVGQQVCAIAHIGGWSGDWWYCKEKDTVCAGGGYCPIGYEAVYVKEKCPLTQTCCLIGFKKKAWACGGYGSTCDEMYIKQPLPKISNATCLK